MHNFDRLQPPFFLVAPPYIEDKRHKMAVILLVDLDESGALGFVLNNKSKLTLDQVVDHDHLEIPSGISVWHAGPEDPTLGIVLHNQQHHRYEQEIAPGVCLSASQESLGNLISHAVQHSLPGSLHASPATTTLYPFRLLIGYMGWTAGQLEEELQRGQWLIAPLDREILFNVDYQNMWLSVLERTDFKVRDNYLAQHGQWLH